MQLEMMDRESFYAPKPLGKTRSITPEGFMLCAGVAVGRIGTQLYRSGDVKGLTYDAQGVARIERTADQVFHPESMASGQGKAITVSHPDEFVTPANWKRYSVGTAHNLRRGEGTEDGLLIADLLITSADGIAYINNSDKEDMPEVSAGYHAEYVQKAPGTGYQHSIIYNHFALVKRGRAGPRCAIKDEETPMKSSFMDRVSRLFTAVEAKDVAGVTAALAEETTDASAASVIAPVSARVEQLATEVAALTQALRATTDKAAAEAATAAAAAKATADAAAAAEAARVASVPVYTADTLSQIVSRAEILSPGIAIPTTDALAAEAPKLMTLALTNATEGALAEHVKPFLLGRELKTLTGDALLGVFMGAAELARVRNNSKTAVAAAKATKDSAGGPVTAADMNAAATALWTPK
jgi:hypothetical protein